MPKQYEAIRDRLKAEGKSDKAAKTSAAKIFNAARKPGQAPVTGKHKRRGKMKKRGKNPSANKPMPNSPRQAGGKSGSKMKWPASGTARIARGRRTAKKVGNKPWRGRAPASTREFGAPRGSRVGVKPRSVRRETGTTGRPGKKQKRGAKKLPMNRRKPVR